MKDILDKVIVFLVCGLLFAVTSLSFIFLRFTSAVLLCLFSYVIVVYIRLSFI